MKHIYILHAKINESNHTFIELFTSPELISEFLNKHPNIIKEQITLHEINPL